MHKIVAVVVTYNGVFWVEKCLNSLMNSIMQTHIIVIDNGSTDATIKSIKDKFPGVELIEARENLGFGKANNIGIKKAVDLNAEYVFLLNQDAWVENNCVGQLVNCLEEHPEFGIVSPMQYYNKEKLESKFEYYYKSSLSSQNNPGILSTKCVNAAVWLVSMKCILKVGGFNPIFYHYGEDYNFIDRCKFFNYKVGIDVNSRAYHERSQLQPQLNFKRQKQLYIIELYAFLVNINNSFFHNYFILLKATIRTAKNFLVLFKIGKLVNHFIIFLYCQFLVIPINFGTIMRNRELTKTEFPFLELK